MELNSKNIKKILILVFLSAIIVCSIFNFTSVLALAGRIYSIFSPITAALCIAFILNVLLNAIENKIFGFMGKAKSRFVKAIRRPICLILTYLVAIGILSLLVLVIIPDIIDTVMYVINKLPGFLENAYAWAVETAPKFRIPVNKIPTLNMDFDAITKAAQSMLSSYSSNIVDGAINITSSVIGGIYDTIFSIVISIYVLAQKERIGRFLKKVIDSFTTEKTAKTIYHVASHASDSFSRFIGGQLIEAVILGVLCYIGMLIFRFPNAAIISVLIAVTSLVPVVGSFTGVAVGFLLILITDPIKALLFIAFILILQQLEGNLIYPRVVGKAVGLPGVIVISAVLVGGNLGGVLGALLSVPLSALIFTLLKEAIQNRKKNHLEK